MSKKLTINNEDIYYYYTNHIHAISNIKYNRIKISSYEAINDIHELIPINFENNFNLYNRYEIAKKEVNSYSGFLSFSLNWNNSIMWGHYGDNYKGICLGYKISNDAKDNIISIEYIPEKEKIPFKHDKVSNDKIKEHYQSIINKKSINWAYGQEFRLNIQFRDKDPETGLYFHHLDNDIVLEQIILGTKSEYTPYDIGGFLKRIKFNNSVIIAKTRPSINTFEMEKLSYQDYDLIQYKPDEGCYPLKKTETINEGDYELSKN